MHGEDELQVALANSRPRLHTGLCHSFAFQCISLPESPAAGCCRLPPAAADGSHQLLRAPQLLSTLPQDKLREEFRTQVL